ncbi:hypothetical protein HDU97_000730 [Phlyctochytrium planicorne]|nr:hypothetical protein HDU97_000730 [Phlyctochytrium planicorne]
MSSSFSSLTIVTAVVIGGCMAIAAAAFAFAWYQSLSSRIAKGTSQLKGKVVLITGASRGIGEQLAYQYSSQKAIVILAARTISKLNAVAEACKGKGCFRVHVIQFDALDEESCSSLVHKAASLENGRLDVVVLNHAMSIYKPLFELELKERINAVKEMIQANYIGYVTIALTALSYLESKPDASISTSSPTSSLIVVSSLAGKFPTPSVHAYSASKHAIDGYFMALRYELEAKWAKSPPARKVIVTKALLGAIKTENFLETVPENVHAMAVSPEGTAKAIMEMGAAGVEQSNDNNEDIRNNFTARPSNITISSSFAMVGVSQAVSSFLKADDLEEIMASFETWKHACLAINPTTLTRPYDTYVLLKTTTSPATHHLKNFWKCIDARLQDPSPLSTLITSSPNISRKKLEVEKKDETQDKESQTRIAVVGGGPAGFFAAVRACLLKPESCVVVEKRGSFGRFNVMRIHQGDMEELCQMFGARDFHSQLGITGFDSIPIRRLQIILSKMALILGTTIHSNTTLTSITSTETTHSLSTEPPLPTPSNINALIIATGVATQFTNTSLDFDRATFRTSNLIGITVNMTIPKTPRASTAQDGRQTISGGVVQYCLPAFFKTLREKGIDLENIAQYNGDRGHTYIVMTPRKASLLSWGVLKEDKKDTQEIVDPSNVCREKLLDFVGRVADEVGTPEGWEIRKGKGGKEDVSVFDFSTRRVARVPCKMIFGSGEAEKVMCPPTLPHESSFVSQSPSPPISPIDADAMDVTATDATPVPAPSTSTPVENPLLIALVGDALVVPFWPLGTGWACACNSTAWAVETVRVLGPKVDQWKAKSDSALSRHMELFLKKKGVFAN